MLNEIPECCYRMIMSTTTQESFAWTTHAQAAALLDRTIALFCTHCPAAADLAKRMLNETGTRFGDWIDHILIPLDQLSAWRAVGFVGDDIRLNHPGGRFPTIAAGSFTIAIRVESVADCCAALGISTPIEGTPGPGLRRATIAYSKQATLSMVERLGSVTLTPTACAPELHTSSILHLERFRCRDRSADQGFATIRALIMAAVYDLGKDVACDLFFTAERDYWQRRNTAGRVQKARQDTLGLGWANHDHHTYRSSRSAFTSLIDCLELLGFACRERFYAGQEAGWGAQVLEQSTTGIVIFADVDMSPDELRGDFSHQAMPEHKELGTVGMWCALHGEAFLAAGMHHLEATFDFSSACTQLQACGVTSMKPFTDFPYLRQCFTSGERWMVDPNRLDSLCRAGHLTKAQATEFKRDGVIGSHLEILERNNGFKGFNQHGVSEIIAATDPRRQKQAG